MFDIEAMADSFKYGTKREQIEATKRIFAICLELDNALNEDVGKDVLDQLQEMYKTNISRKEKKIVIDIKGRDLQFEDADEVRDLITYLFDRLLIEKEYEVAEEVSQEVTDMYCCEIGGI